MIKHINFGFLVRLAISVSLAVVTFLIGQQPELFIGSINLNSTGANAALAIFVGMMSWMVTTSFSILQAGARTEASISALSGLVAHDIKASETATNLYKKIHSFSQKGDIVCDVAIHGMEYALAQFDVEDDKASSSGVRMRGHSISLNSYQQFWKLLENKVNREKSGAPMFAATTHSSPITIWRRKEYQELIAKQKSIFHKRGYVLRIFIDRLEAGSSSEIDEYVSVMNNMKDARVLCVYVASDQIQDGQRAVLDKDLCLINRDYLTAIWTNSADGSVAEFVVNDQQAVYERYRTGEWGVLLSIVKKYDYDGLAAFRRKSGVDISKHKVFLEQSRRAFVKVADRMNNQVAQGDEI